MQERIKDLDDQFYLRSDHNPFCCISLYLYLAFILIIDANTGTWMRTYIHSFTNHAYIYVCVYGFLSVIEILYT